MTTTHAVRAKQPWFGANVRMIDAVRLERVLFAVTIACAASLVWLAHRPPMVDLPQHAAQVTLWRDLILGRSAWSDIVRTNLLTPYLIGYGVTLPFSFVLPIESAIRLVLSLSFLAYMGACIALRRSFGGDARLDWLFFFGFFGFAWQFGFLTFLVAAPVALVFLLLSDRFGRNPGVPGSAAVLAVGVILLFSHGLQFALGLAIGGLLALGRNIRPDVRRIALVVSPFAALVGIAVGFRWLTAQSEGAMQFDAVKYGEPLWLRPLATLAYVTGIDLTGNLAPLCATLLMLFTPRLRGASFHRGVALIPFAILMIWMALLPNYAFQTAFLFNRFSLFLLPFFALMFRQPSERSPVNSWLFAPMVCATWLMLGITGYRVHAFDSEARAFDTVLQAAAPQKRALALLFDPASPASDMSFAYLHFPSWYQADKGGFVDFNFAAYHPQIVRFRPGHTPQLGDNLSRSPERFGGNVDLERRYDYIFTRGSDADVTRLISKSVCQLTVRAADGAWTLLERGDCPS